MNRVSLLFLTVLLFSCEQKKDSTMIIEDENVLVFKEWYTSSNKWYKIVGNISIDSLVLCNGEKVLKLSPSEQDSIRKILACFYFNFSEIEGDSINISGKYKVRTTRNSKILFSVIQQNPENRRIDSVPIESPLNQDWKDFEIKAPLIEDAVIFLIYAEGDTEISVSNCQAMIDGIPFSEFINKKYSEKTDNEFNNSSNIELRELTPQMTENLEILGKVWGFLKYYHPEVTQGKYNWDYELFRVLPDIANTKDRYERNKLLNKWVDRYGKIKETADYTITDSSKYSRIIDLEWLEDRTLFDDKLIDKLQRIKNAKRSKKFNYYIVPHKSGFDWPVLRERTYKNIKWDDQGFRILTLFRLWNAIKYCFPYTDYTDTPWDTLLKDFIPKFVSPKDKANYELTILELGAKIDDSHGYIAIPYNNLDETVMAPIYYKTKVPVELTFSEEGYIIVKSSQSDFLKRGDIITSVEGKEVNDIIEEMRPYIIASNKNGLIRNTLNTLLSADLPYLNIDVIRDGKKVAIEIKSFNQNKQDGNVKSHQDYNLDEKNIILLDNTMSIDENKISVQKIMNSKGLIIDMRQYPQNNNLDRLSPLILSKYPLWISKNDKSYPGNYSIKLGYGKINEPEKKPNYKGKIVILVDENTQSAGETGAMELRVSPRSVIVGRQTAGANGNIGRIYLPGEIEFRYTQLGAYYPNWGILQRKGVKIDVPVSPTIDDIKKGRDVWIEKAIEIIENK